METIKLKTKLQELMESDDLEKMSSFFQACLPELFQSIKNAYNFQLEYSVSGFRLKHEYLERYLHLIIKGLDDEYKDDIEKFISYFNE